METHSSTLAWKIPWMEEYGRLQSMGLQRVRHVWVTSPSLTLKLESGSQEMYAMNIILAFLYSGSCLIESDKDVYLYFFPQILKYSRVSLYKLCSIYQ